MEIEARPPLEEAEREAVMLALVRAGAIVDAHADAAAASVWRRAGLEEAIEDAEDGAYTPSPRSTFGATRA